MSHRIAKPVRPEPAPIVWPRADPAALASFDPRTKVCSMNCGRSTADPRTHAHRLVLETPAAAAYATKLLANQRGGWRLVAAAAGAALLAGCSGMTQPEDIAVAEELCGKRGGFTHVARYERGDNLVINCKDGTHIDVRLPKKA